MTRYLIYNEILGSVIERTELPAEIAHLAPRGEKQIGPSINNDPAPRLYITDSEADMADYLRRNGREVLA